MTVTVVGWQERGGGFEGLSWLLGWLRRYAYIPVLISAARAVTSPVPELATCASRETKRPTRFVSTVGGGWRALHESGPRSARLLELSNVGSGESALEFCSGSHMLHSLRVPKDGNQNTHDPLLISGFRRSEKRDQSIIPVPGSNPNVYLWRRQ